MSKKGSFLCLTKRTHRFCGGCGMGVSREEGAGRTTRKRGEGAWSKSWATNRGTQQQQKQQQYEDGSLSSYRRPDCKGIGQRIGGEEKKIGGAVSRVKWLEVVRVWRRKSRGTSGADRVGRRRARHWIVVRWRISCKVFSFLLNPRKRYWLLVVLFVRYSFFFPVCFV